VQVAQGEQTPRHIEGRGDGSRRQVDRWTLRWREHLTCGQLDDGNSASDDMQTWSRGGFGIPFPFNFLSRVKIN
jgi:hypothetical protein